MTGADFDDVAHLWRQEPSSDDQKLFERTARQATGRARLLHRIEIASRLVFAASLAAVLVWRPSPAAFAIGALMLLTLSWSSARHDELRRMAAEAEIGDRVLFLEWIQRGAESRLTNARLGLWLYGAGVALGFLMATSLVTDGDVTAVFREVARRAATTPSSQVLLVQLAALLVRLLQTYFSVRAELRRIVSLQRVYREEAGIESDASRAATSI